MGAFYSESDVDGYGPYDTFAEAANVVGLFYARMRATTGLWIEPEFRNDEVNGRLPANAKVLLEEGGKRNALRRI